MDTIHCNTTPLRESLSRYRSTPKRSMGTPARFLDLESVKRDQPTFNATRSRTKGSNTH